MNAPGLRGNDGRHDEARLDELDALLAEAASVVSTATSPTDFATRLLRLAIQAAQGVSGAVWAQDTSGRWSTERNTDDEAVGNEEMGSDRRADIVRHVAETGVPRLGPTDDANDDPGSGLVSVFAPMAPGVLELRVPAATAERDGRLLVEIARSFAEIGSEYLRARELDDLRRQSARSRRLDAFTRAAYRSLEPGPTAYAIANDGRTAIGCDRLTVTTTTGGRVLAVSGVEYPDRRSDAVRHLERLAEAAIDSGGRYWQFRGQQIRSDADRPSPELERCWQQYAGFLEDVAVDLVVLKADDHPEAPPEGTLIAEWFGGIAEASSQSVLPVAAHAGQALRNSRQATPGPLEAGLRKLTAPFRRRNWSRTAVATVVLLVLGGILAFLPADFVVNARGRLMPVQARDVFAPSDGVVKTLAVRHGDAVARDEELLSLIDPQLDLEHERIVGELGTARQRLLAVQAERATANRTDPTQPVRQLAADERELTAKIESLERQLEILDRQRGQLSVRSPLEGVVLTWEADERLEGRPVRRGQRLLTVVDLDENWQLELFIPDRSTRHVLAAQDSVGNDLPIDYLLATEPRTTYHASLDRVALSTEPNDDGEPSLRAVAELPRSAVPAPRPGATVVANIHCGQRAIGYVWFHEIYEAFLTHVLF